MNQTFNVAAIILAGLISAVNEPALSRELNVELRASEKENAPVTESVKLYSASYALIIGNDGYSGTWPRLSNAIRDAELVAETMRAKGFDVTLKTELKSVEL
ncbi:MAG: caspase family protein, partial [Alphaproteobacteria bacterium]